MPGLIIILLLINLLLAAGFLYLYRRGLGLKAHSQKNEKELKQKIYELSILKEVGGRIGYSLNIQNIAEVITNSLNQFLEYSTAGYLLIGTERIILRIHCEKNVSRQFIDDVKSQMLQSLSALLNKDFSQEKIEEVVSGAIAAEEISGPLRSFFNIPLVIGNDAVGVLTIASTQAGLYKEEDMTLLYQIVKMATGSVSRLQELIKSEEKKLNAMVESMKDGLVMVDKDYRVLVANPAAKRIADLKKENPSLFDFIDKLGEKFDIRSKIEESIKLGRSLVSEEILLGDHFLKILTLPVRSGSNNSAEVLGSVVIFQDITPEKEIQKMRDDFTAVLVHELRSPLDGIKKMAELMGESDLRKNPKEHKEFLGLIYKSASEMLELVNTLLDVAKLEAGKFEIKREIVNIKEVIEERIKFFDALAKTSNIDIALQWNINAPEKLNVDSFRTAQVLNNLLSNAIKFTRPQGKIIVSGLLHKKGNNILEEAKSAGIQWLLKGETQALDNLDNCLVIAVTDNGIGIPAEEINQLFNKFKQLKTKVIGEKRGSGLGLIIAKGIIEAHGGIIGVQSEEDRGSTFYFTLPLETQIL